MDKIKSKLIQIIDSLFINLVVSTLVTLLSLLIPAVKHLLLTYVNSNILVTSGMLLVITFLLFDLVKRHFLYYTVYLKKNEINRIYDYYQYTFEFVEREYIRCSIRLRFRNTKSSFKNDTFRFKWNGSGYNLTVKNCRTEQIQNESGFYEYLILFPRSICRNEKVDLEINLDLYDTYHTAAPEMQFNVNHPTKNLKMKLKFPPGLELNYVTKECLIGNSEYPVTSEECDCSEREFTLTKKNPLFLHKYKFGWDYKN